MIPGPSTRRIAAVLIACALAIALPGVALGHAELKTPTPAADSVQTKPVTQVSGVFTEDMSKDGSSLELFDAAGKSLDKGGLDPKDDTRMVIDLDAALTAGAYTVKWTSVATDGHVERGEWAFTVAAAPTPSPTPAATPTATATASLAATSSAAPTPTATPAVTAGPAPPADGTATASSTDVLLPIIVALIVLGAGAAYLLTRRNRPSNPA
jgi:methionine-rich copper-binding protein CopC